MILEQNRTTVIELFSNRAEDKDEELAIISIIRYFNCFDIYIAEFLILDGRYRSVSQVMITTLLQFGRYHSKGSCFRWEYQRQ